MSKHIENYSWYSWPRQGTTYYFSLEAMMFSFTSPKSERSSGFSLNEEEWKRVR